MRIMTITLLAVLAAACTGHAMSPLVAAAREGRVAEVQLLLKDGADPNRPEGVNDWPPLLHAIHKGQNDAAIALLEGGANASGASGVAALAMAAGYGNAPMVRELLRRGADPRLAPGGVEALLADAVGGSWDIDYRWSGCEGHTESVRLLLEAVPEVHLSNGAFATLAKRQARKEGCKELLALVGG